MFPEYVSWFIYFISFGIVFRDVKRGQKLEAEALEAEAKVEEKKK